MKIIKTITYTLLFTTTLLRPIETEFTIEAYDPERDEEAVVAILDQYPDLLRYEIVCGSPEGTTEKYLTSPKYITKVLRVDDETVGFINYCTYNATFLTFYFGRQGIIHLLGVDEKHQRKGYGRTLLKHAVKHLEELYTPNIRIETVKENEPAQSLYTQEGFLCVIPDFLKEKMTSWIYLLELDIPEDKLPKGNIIQRYPKTSAIIVATVIGGITYLFKSKDSSTEHTLD